jgi:hypothetical protein
LGGMGVVVGNGFKIYPGKIRQYDLWELGLKIHSFTPLVTKNSGSERK